MSLMFPLFQHYLSDMNWQRCLAECILYSASSLIISGVVMVYACTHLVPHKWFLTSGCVLHMELPSEKFLAYLV